MANHTDTNKVLRKHSERI